MGKDKDKPETSVEIALQSDKRYFPGLLMTACSVAEHALGTTALRFNILDGGLESRQKQELETTVLKLHKLSSFNYLTIDTNIFNALPEWRGSGKMTWSRILLPSLLPDVEWVIYIDVDFLCLGDITELWSLRASDISLSSVIENWPYTTTIESDWFNRNGKTFNPNTYFCAGILLINLNRFRSEHLDTEILHILQSNNMFPTVDQSVLNLLFVDRADLMLLPPKWQRFSRDIKDEDFTEHPFIHYASEAPWVSVRTNRILNDASMFWFRHYARITETSTICALRNFYSIPEIICYRVLYLALSRIRILHWAFNVIMRLIKHESSIVIYNAFLHRVHYPTIRVNGLFAQRKHYPAQ